MLVKVMLIKRFYTIPYHTIPYHTHLLRYNHELRETVEVSVPFFLHLRRQIIKCPLCSFKAKNVKSTRSFLTHFSRHGNRYNLQIAHTCSVCSEVMTTDEVQQHLDMHRSNRLALTPTTNKPCNHNSPDPTTSSPSTVDTSSTSSSPPSSLPLSTPPPKSPASLDSQTLPDTQNPMSPSAPSPPSFSPPLLKPMRRSCVGSSRPVAIHLLRQHRHHPPIQQLHSLLSPHSWQTSYQRHPLMSLRLGNTLHQPIHLL